MKWKVRAQRFWCFEDSRNVVVGGNMEGYGSVFGLGFGSMFWVLDPPYFGGP